MGLFSGKQDIVLDRRESLEGVPILNEGARITREEDGRILIHIPSGGARGLMARLLPALPDSQIRLDELGSFVFAQIDGKRNVFQIIKSFTKEYGVNRREAEQSVVNFLKSLTQRRVISIVIK